MKCPKCNADNPDTLKFCGECGTQLPSIEEIEVTETLETPKEELTRGTTFAGRYEIIEELGKGGMGRVYRVEDTKLKQEVALKLIKPEIAKDKKTIERFRNELKLARNIRHKNVCGMFDLGETEDAHFITMEYVRGEDLRSSIRRFGQLPIGKSISIAKQICEGLSEAHRLGVVHRDLKSNNIMIDNEGNVRIMDFGIARSLDAKGITGAGVMIGTPEYMSPEQVEGKEVDQRSDIYSLGVILYEMLAGRVPFEGDTPFTVGVKQKSEIPQDPKEQNTQISDDLNGLILRCLEKEKDKRYQSVGEVHSELKNIEEGIPTTERIAPDRKPLTSREITVRLSFKKIFIPALILIALVIAVVAIWQFIPRKDVTPIPSGTPSIAIMYFKNNTGDETLDHWRTMLPNLLVADLTQSKYVRVLGEDRLFDILTQLNQEEATTYSSAVLRQVSAQGGVSHILQGAYAKAGEEFRINVTLQEGKTGELIRSETVSGKGAESIFDMVDELTRRVKAGLKLSEEEILDDIDESIGTITTSSPEAYKFYVEGLNYGDTGEYKTAIEYYEKAIAIDPEFATAYKSLAIMYYDLGLRSEYQKNLEKAMELRSRSSEREKYRIEAEFYWLSESTQEKSLEAYQKLLDIYQHDSSKNNYGLSLAQLGRWDEALEIWEDMRRSKTGGLHSYYNLADYSRRKGLYQKAKEVLLEYFKNFPDSFMIQSLMAEINSDFGHFDQALLDIEKAFSIDPTNPFYYMTKGSIYLCMNEFEKAEGEYRKLIEKEDNYSKANGLWELAVLYFTQARLEESKRSIEQLITVTREMEQPRLTTGAHIYLGRILIESGELEKAIEYFDTGWKMAVESEAFDLQRYALFNKGQAKIMMKSLDEAQNMAEDLKALCQQALNKNLMGMYYCLIGMIDLEKKNYSSAVESFEMAVSLDPDISNEYINYLADAYFESGELDKAGVGYEDMTSLPRGIIRNGYRYIRAFYMLGKIHEQQGDTDKAIEQYEKFLDLWKNADPGIAEVEDARKRLAGLRGQILT